jgi:hypothetical protein
MEESVGNELRVVGESLGYLGLATATISLYRLDFAERRTDA